MDSYEFQPDEIRALAERGMTLIGRKGIDYRNHVWVATNANVHQFVVKSIPYESDEVAMLLRFSRWRSSSNYTIPVELIRCTQTVLAVMPRLPLLSVSASDVPDLQTLFDAVAQALEGVQFLHEAKIAHIDIAISNVVFSIEAAAIGSFTILPRSLFLIDFGSSRSFSLGPHRGEMVTFFRTGGAHFQPPEGLELVDPYAFDIYCLGRTLGPFTAAVQSRSKGHVRVPPCMWHYLSTFVEDSPDKRPSIRRARRLFLVLRTWVNMTNWLHAILRDDLCNVITSSGWWVLSKLVP